MKCLYVGKDKSLEVEDIDPSVTFYEADDGYHVLDETSTYKDENGENPLLVIRSGHVECKGSDKAKEEVDRSLFASRVGKYMDVEGTVTSTSMGRKLKNYIRYGVLIMVFGLIAYGVIGDLMGWI